MKSKIFIFYIVTYHTHVVVFSAKKIVICCFIS